MQAVARGVEIRARLAIAALKREDGTGRRHAQTTGDNR
jgi:hypothetical protein